MADSDPQGASPTGWLGLAVASARARAALLAPVAGAVALAGGLMAAGLAVGDGLRDALAQRAERAAGPVGWLLEVRGREVTAALAARLADDAGRAALAGWRVPASASAGARSRGVDVLGVDGAWFAAANLSEGSPGADEAWLGATTAAALGVAEGDAVVVRVTAPSAVPRDVALVVADATVTWRLTVARVLPDVWPATFATTLGPGARPVVLVDREALAAQLGRPGRANVVAVVGEDAPQADALAHAWTLEDAGLSLVDVAAAPYAGGQKGWQLRADDLLLDDAVRSAAMAAGEALGVAPTASLTWFVDRLEAHGRATPASFVSGLDLGGGAALAAALPALRGDEVVVNDWLAEDLGLAEGDRVTVRYHRVGRGRATSEEAAQLTVVAVLPTVGPAAEATWTPPYEGLDGKADCRDWEPGLPVDLSAIRDEDEAYWDAQGPLPKVWMGLDTARALFANPFGDATGVRFPGHLSREAVADAVLGALTPASRGLVLQPVGARLRAQAVPANDFGALFLGFQSVLLMSAAALALLQVGLALDTRRRELGLLRALGHGRGRVLGALAAEGAVVGAVGALGAGPLAIALAAALRAGLDGAWATSVGGIAVPVVVGAEHVAVGAAVAVVGAAAATGWAGWRLLRAAPAALLRGPSAEAAGVGRWVAPVGLGLLGGAVAIGLGAPAGRTPEGAAAFFGAAFVGFGGLVALAVAALARAPGALGAGAAGRRPGRAASVLGLLGAGVLLVVGVGLGGGMPVPDPTRPSSGTGGYGWWVRTTRALPGDPAAPAVADALGIRPGELVAAATLPLRVHEADEASCLNLGLAAAPVVYGADTARLGAREAFRFLTAPATSGSPWLALRLPGGVGVEAVAPEDAPVGDLLADAPAWGSSEAPIPAVGDVGTVTWGLHAAVGDVLRVPDGRGGEVALQIVGLLENTVLQGGLLIDLSAFEAVFAEDPGPRALLVDGGPEVGAVLSRALRDHGADVIPAAERLAAFAAVEHTYVSMFHALGGLGLALGALGVGLVLLRAVAERRSELVLLRAIGFSRGRLAGLLVAEQGLLVGLAVLLGAAAAAVAVAPVVRAPEAHPPWGLAAAVVSGVALAGVGAVAAAAWRATGRVDPRGEAP